jgi:hypothetical protein
LVRVWVSGREYAAVHVLVTIPHYDSVEKISQALSIGLKRVSEIVAFLLKAGLMSQMKESSVHILKHHSHWRLKAIESLSEPGTKDVHYTTVSSLSKKDVEKIRSLLTDTVQTYTETVKGSKEETLYGFNLDFYRVIKD